LKVRRLALLAGMLPAPWTVGSGSSRKAQIFLSRASSQCRLIGPALLCEAIAEHCASAVQSIADEAHAEKILCFSAVSAAGQSKGAGSHAGNSGEPPDFQSNTM